MTRLAGLLRRLRAGVVHGHSLTGNVLGIGAAALAGARVRVGHVHTQRDHWYGRGLRGWSQQWQETLVLRRLAGRVLLGNRESLDWYQRATGLPRELLTVLHNGLDPDRLRCALGRQEARAALGAAEDDVLLGFVGRLAPGKGLEDFVDFGRRAMDGHPRLRLVAVGDGELMGAVDNRTTRGVTARWRS